MEKMPSSAPQTVSLPRALFVFSLLYGGLVVLAGVLGAKIASLGTWPVVGNLAVESGIFCFLLLVVLSSTTAELYGQKAATTDGGAHAQRSARGVHRFADMTMAHDVVKLPIAQFEEALGFPVAIVLQPFGAQQRVLEGHRQRRAVAAHQVALLQRIVFGAWKRRQKTRRLAFQKFSPTLETLGTIHSPGRRLGLDLGYLVQLIQCLMPHGNLLVRWFFRPLNALS